MSELAAAQKQLKIKTGVVQRYEKEVSVYRKEVEDLKKKLDSLENGDEWDVKNTNRLIEESGKMVKDTETRLGKAIGELGDLVTQVEGKAGVAETEEFRNAVKAAKREGTVE